MDTKFKTYLTENLKKGDFNYWKDGYKKSRVDALVKKISSGEPLIGAVRGGKPDVVIDPTVLRDIQSASSIKDFPDRLPVKGGGSIPWSDLQKTKDFGSTKSVGDARAEVKAVSAGAEGKMPKSGKFDSTKHEVNICYGVTRRWCEKNNKYDITKDTPHEEAWEVMNLNKAFGGASIPNNECNYHEAAMDAGYRTAVAINRAQISYPTSGGRISGIKLHPTYVKYGAASLEPKTDIMIGKDRVSVKNAKNAQLGSSQAGEAAAMFSVCCDAVPHSGFTSENVVGLMYQTLEPRGWTRLRKEFGGSIDSPTFDGFMTRIATGSEKVTLEELKAFNNKVNEAVNPAFAKQVFDNIESRRNKLAGNVKAETVEYYMVNNWDQYKDQAMIVQYVNVGLGRDAKTKVSKRDFEKYLASLTPKQKNASGYKVIIGLGKHPIVDMQIEAIKAAWSSTIPDINKEIMDFLQSQELRTELIKEAATGYHKFQNGTASANYMLGWREDGYGAYDKVTDGLMKKYSNCVKIRFSDRGRTQSIGGEPVKVGSIRINIGKSCFAESVFDAYDECHDKITLTEEDEKWCEEFSEAYTDLKYESMLTEGVFDSFKKYGKKLLDATVRAIKFVLNIFANVIARSVRLVQKAFKDGKVGAMRLFGIGQDIRIEMS